MQQEASSYEMKQLPGNRFCPMEDELLLLFLKPLLSGKDQVIGRGKVVFDDDLYGTQEPWEIWDKFKNQRPHDLRLHKDLYFFTKHKKAKPTDKRFIRTIGGGTWKGNDAEVPVESLETGCVIGYKKRFTYENTKSEHHKLWILREFFFDPSFRCKNKEMKEYVLCQLRKNGEPQTVSKKNKSKKRNQLQNEEEDVVDHARNDEEEPKSMREQQGRQKLSKHVDMIFVPQPQVPLLPSEDDEFIAELEKDLSCDEDEKPIPTSQAIGFQENEYVMVHDNSHPPPQIEAIGFQGVQQLSSEEVQYSNPNSLVPLHVYDYLMYDNLADPAQGGEAFGFQGVHQDEGIQTFSSEEVVQYSNPNSLAPLHVDDYLMDERSPPLLQDEAFGLFQGVENYGGLVQQVQPDPSLVSHLEDAEIGDEFGRDGKLADDVEMEKQAGSNNESCVGLIGGDDQEVPDDNWINTISFEPEDNWLF